MRTMTKTLIAAALASSLAYAQATNPADQKKTTGKTAPASTTATKPAPVPAKSAAKPAATAAKPMTTAAKPMTSASKPSASAGKPMAKSVPAKTLPAKAPMKIAAKPVATPVTHAAAKKPAAAHPSVVEPGQKEEVRKVAGATPAGKRDPFVNPIQRQDEMAGDKAVCTTGPRCLMIAQVVLKGVIKTPRGMIAMVENAAKKEYNLHEKDPVLNGFVLKITSDSIVFRENLTDFLGRPATREVVKRVTVPVV